MPFNGSGTFSIVNTFIPNTTILSAAVNANFSDIATGLTNCLTRDGQAGMNAALGIVSGSVNAPGLKFNSEPGTGLYLAASQTIGVAIASAAAFSFAAPSTAAGAGIIGSAGAVILPVGVIQDYCGSAAPTGWLLCFGQEVSRTTYTQLFAAVGTNWGTASTATAFVIPDLRGRALYGKDDMGGSAANRITNGVSGVVGTTLGATGGDQGHTMLLAEMVAHNHGGATGNDSPDHTHTVPVGFTSTNIAGGVTSTAIAGTTASGNPNVHHTHTIATAGSTTPFTVLNPAAIINKIIFAGHG